MNTTLNLSLTVYSSKSVGEWSLLVRKCLNIFFSITCYPTHFKGTLLIKNKYQIHFSAYHINICGCFCPYINVFGLQVIISRVHLALKTKNTPIFFDFLAIFMQKNDGGSHGNGSINQKIIY